MRTNFATWVWRVARHFSAPIALMLIALLLETIVTAAAAAEREQPGEPAASAQSAADKPTQPGAEQQAEREAAFVKMLSGATLEGSYTNTSASRELSKLSREKYTIGEVKKIAPNMWLIPARIEYGDHDATLPVVVPIQWAGDTPVIIVDNLGLPGFGTVSARVMFFDNHYAGYWKHGQAGGHLFGIIRPSDKTSATSSDRADQ